MMQVRAVVGGGALACGPETTLRSAAEEMINNEMGSLAVISEGKLVGIFTERDALRAVAGGASLDEDFVTAWMTPDPDTADPELSCEDAARWMLATGYRHLPIMERGTLLGIASIKDVLWAIAPVED